MFRRFISIAVSALMILAEAPAVMAGTEPAGAGAPEEQPQEETAYVEDVDLDHGGFAPGEVIVTFRDGAVKDRKASLAAVRKLENVDADFGAVMESAGEEKEAAEDAKSEAAILEESLGQDFVIEDSVAFDEDFTMCLVSSDKYDTEALIEKLSQNDAVESATANWYTEEKADYALNDALNQYVYHVNSPADHNTAGRGVTTHGDDPDKAVSTRAGSVVDFTKDHSEEQEVVIAVTDSGINYDHEDLQGVLWNNPGNIGLAGEHGFNFEDNAEDVKDRHGHGTHVSGIIAAQANNAKGVAGTASGVNVKIMMLATASALEEPDTDLHTVYRNAGAFYYALRAKQRGVNIVATSNSWGSPGGSFVYDKVFNLLGKEGVLNFLAASNEGQNTDQVKYTPQTTDSPYVIKVGSALQDGRASGFTNYGKASVDMFAPGSNILSTMAYSVYFPNLYTAEERAENTEYYGQFSTATEVGAAEDELGTNRVVPDTAGEGVKPFEAAKFFKQDKYADEDPDEGVDPGDGGGEDPGDGGGEGGDGGDDGGRILPEAECELSIEPNWYFTDNLAPGASAKPASLKVHIKNANFQEKYFLYFPYAKNHRTTGIDNTRYSMTVKLEHGEDEFDATVLGSEVVKYEKDGKVICKAPMLQDSVSKDSENGEVSHFTVSSRSNVDGALLSWEEADPETTDVVESGLGLSIEPCAGEELVTEEERAFLEEPHDIVVYLDSLGVSEPTAEGVDADELFPADSSYDLMSGTSMATPAAAGAYAVLASLYPKKAGQTGADYAQENRARYLSYTTPTPEFEELCRTGGYIDLSRIGSDDEKPAVTDAVCDLKNGTLTLKGINLKKNLKLSVRSLAKSGKPETALPAKGMKLTYAADGRSVKISGAKSLFGRYLEFLFKNAGGEIRARGTFFTVKGQKKLKKVLTEENKQMAYGDESELMPRYLMTDKSGKSLYAYQMNSCDVEKQEAGVLYKYDGNKFVRYPGTGLRDSLFDLYEKKGYDRNQIVRGLTVQPAVMRQPVYANNTLYDFVEVEYSPKADAEDEEIERKTYLAKMKYTAAKPAWTFREIEPLRDSLEAIAMNLDDATFCFFNGRIWCFGISEEEDDATVVYSCDPAKMTWKRGPDYKGAALGCPYVYVNSGKMYLMCCGGAKYKLLHGVYSFDGKTWKKTGTIPFVGRQSTYEYAAQAAVAPVKEGFLILNHSADGAGNVYIYNPATGKCKPLYYTMGDSLSDCQADDSSQSAIETPAGIYFLQLAGDSGSAKRVELYLLPKSSLAYQTRYKDPNPAKITRKNVKVKYSRLKKKTLKRKAVTVRKNKGAVTYKRVRIACKAKLKKAAKKKIRVLKGGKIKLVKGLKKGTYTVTVRVRVKGNALYKAKVKNVKIRITVR